MNSIVKGFNDPIHDAQNCFRKILKALSEPGKQCIMDKHQGLAPLNAAASQIMMSLCDQQTGVHICSAINHEGEERILQHCLDNLIFHNSVVTCSQDKADFVVTSGKEEFNFNDYKMGTDENPEEGATIIVQTDSFCGGACFRISGPGIKNAFEVHLGDLSYSLQSYLLNPEYQYPLGLDFMFCYENTLIAISRTTKVELV